MRPHAEVAGRSSDKRSPAAADVEQRLAGRQAELRAAAIDLAVLRVLERHRRRLVRDLFLTALQHCYAAYFAAMQQLERPTSADGFWDYVHRATVLGYGLMLEDPTAAHLMQCMQRERALLGELVSSELLASMQDFYDAGIRDGQRLGAIRSDMPHSLLVDTVRDVAMTFDRWFITARSQGGDAPAPDQAATLFTDVIRRICTPTS